MKDKLKALSKKVLAWRPFTWNEAPQRTKFLSLHMQQVTNDGWLVRMSRNQRLNNYLWEPPRN